MEQNMGCYRKVFDKGIYFERQILEISLWDILHIDKQMSIDFMGEKLGVVMYELFQWCGNDVVLQRLYVVGYMAVTRDVVCHGLWSKILRLGTLHPIRINGLNYGVEVIFN